MVEKIFEIRFMILFFLFNYDNENILIWRWLCLGMSYYDVKIFCNVSLILIFFVFWWCFMEFGFSIKIEDSEFFFYVLCWLYLFNLEIILIFIFVVVVFFLVFYYYYFLEREKFWVVLFLLFFVLLCCSFELLVDFVVVCLFLLFVGRSFRGKLEKYVVELYDGGELVFLDLFVLFCL